MADRGRWWVLVGFAVAMAWMEAATVVYLRTLVGRLEPYQPEPLPIHPRLAIIEILREAATMGLLAAAGYLAGTSPRHRFGCFLIAFGVWDIFYYLFLAGMGPWPRSVWDWDVLFLIPLPWWGPVLAPTSIALLMAVGGTLVSQFDRPGHKVWPGRRAWATGTLGAVLALGVFMSDSLAEVARGGAGLSSRLPEHFPWPLFLTALALMAAPVSDALRQAAGRYRQEVAAPPA